MKNTVEIKRNGSGDAAARAEFMRMISELTEAEKLEVLLFISQRFHMDKEVTEAP